MQIEAQRILHQSSDRRVLKSSAEAVLDYWTTYVAGVVWLGYYLWSNSGTKFDAFVLMLGVIVIAITAARDGKKEIHRKLNAIVRQLEEKNLL